MDFFHWEIGNISRAFLGLPGCPERPRVWLAISLARYDLSTMLDAILNVGVRFWKSPEYAHMLKCCTSHQVIDILSRRAACAMALDRPLHYKEVPCQLWINKRSFPNHTMSVRRTSIVYDIKSVLASNPVYNPHTYPFHMECHLIVCSM